MLEIILFGAIIYVVSQVSIVVIRKIKKRGIKVQRKYGWKKDRKDKRDKYYKLIRRWEGTLPQKVDLRATCSPVENQGDIGSCTANALVGALEFLEIKDAKPYMDLSRIYVYYKEREIEGTIDDDAGAEIRDGIKVLAKYGTCHESTWPYADDSETFRKKPSPEADIEAEKHQITSYHRITSVDEMKSCLAEGYPVVFGFLVYPAFESEEVTRTGIVPSPGFFESNIGGHAVMAVGYDESEKRFIVRNSWGPKWGMAGYFTMPYNYVRCKGSDFWTIRAGEEI